MDLSISPLACWLRQHATDLAAGGRCGNSPMNPKVKTGANKISPEQIKTRFFSDMSFIDKEIERRGIEARASKRSPSAPKEKAKSASVSSKKKRPNALRAWDKLSANKARGRKSE